MEGHCSETFPNIFNSNATVWTRTTTLKGFFFCFFGLHEVMKEMLLHLSLTSSNATICLLSSRSEKEASPCPFSSCNLSSSTDFSSISTLCLAWQTHMAKSSSLLQPGTDITNTWQSHLCPCSQEQTSQTYGKVIFAPVTRNRHHKHMAKSTLPLYPGTDITDTWQSHLCPCTQEQTSQTHGKVIFASVARNRHHRHVAKSSLPLYPGTDITDTLQSHLCPTPSQCNSQSVLFSCSLPPAWFDLISPARVSFRPARAF